MNERGFVITGAGSDIGLALTKHLEKVPAHRLLLTTRGQHDLVAAGVSERHVHLTDMDLTKQVCLDRLSDQVKVMFSEPFTLVHCVGDFWYHRDIERTPISEAATMMMSHYCTLYGAVRAALSQMTRVGGGRIIAFSCNSVSHNYPDMAAFTSAKAAVECFIKCLANEHSKNGIVANAIALSTIRTPKVIASKPLEYHERYIAPDELVDAIVDLIEAPSLINGDVIKLLKYSSSFYNEGYYQRNRTISNSSTGSDPEKD